jgi:hypothetical protein
MVFNLKPNNIQHLTLIVDVLAALGPTHPLMQWMIHLHGVVLD